MTLKKASACKAIINHYKDGTYKVNIKNENANIEYYYSTYHRVTMNEINTNTNYTKFEDLED